MRSRCVAIAGVVMLAAMMSGAMPASVMASTTVTDLDSSPSATVVSTIGAVGDPANATTD